MPDNPTSGVSKLDANEIASQAAAIAQHLQRSGVQWLPKAQAEAVESLSERFENPKTRPEESVAGPVAAQTPATPSEQAKSIPAAPIVSSIDKAYAGEHLPVAQRQSQLDEIDDEVKACQRCEILSACRKNTVFGEGSPSPRFVFFGEGPGADEDQIGRPFVGRAGQLLTKMIEACTLNRDDVYILNTVKCRPPGNRNPEPGEIENCRDYYQRQLAILRPEYIVCLGAISSQELLQNKTSVGKMRGRLHRYFESKVLVTYHPAYLLRTPAVKKAAWDDLQLMMLDAGIQVR
jgi:uracil-DNA glycosylase family 4